MANPEHVAIVKGGAEAIDRWREANPDTQLDLSGAVLTGADMRDTDLTGADMRDTDLTGADMRRTDLTYANLTYANLRDTDLTDADLTGADLRDTDLTDADLTGVKLTGADLTRTDLTHANLTSADLRGANIIDGGVDNRGYVFRATWGKGGENIGITAGCRVWLSFDEALAWYGPYYTSNGNRHEIRLRLNFMRDLYLMRTGQLKERG